MADQKQNASNVGILAMETYFPRQFVAQKELEKSEGVSAGKFTIGLGQDNLAYVDDREDIYSICLTVVSHLLEKYQISPASIGRLEVATETILDHSKSIKTVLMQLFQESGNTDIEGIDSMNACYAGTNALFNSVAWVESSAWDGRFALAVAADIAEYAEGPARPTGGCGAVAYLIGPNAPIVLDPRVRASHMEHAYDFYKPHLSSPYPVVDGKFSNTCYLRALDTCYNRYLQKYRNLHGREAYLSDFDYVIFHAPYNKLVQKSYARLVYNEYLRRPTDEAFASLAEFKDVPLEASYEHRNLEQACVRLSTAGYQRQVAPSTRLPKQLGNLYTASLYAGLLSLLTSAAPADLSGKRVLMFSYGSGLAASMFSFTLAEGEAFTHQLQQLQSCVNLEARLEARTETTPALFQQWMTQRERLHADSSAFQPSGSIETLFPGTYYLTSKDQQGRRFYARTAM
eukprot:TRINITY_DN2454_c0_g1_i7.p1 TRINITY_DN2454_c0_g1~~TRINITY_DN2454_c0_g1_i7.p1  ORF type:complete len:478 (-),score=128.95 TRINITY_DN2454_c0_g1_i7:66-1439(-)